MKNLSPAFHLKPGELFAEDLPLSLLAKHYGTPCYVYSKAALLENWQIFTNAFQSIFHQIHYAVKANSNLAILKIFRELGAGFDIVSGGELERVLAIGGDPKKIVFSGVGKSSQEIRRALQIGVGCINVESQAELYRINEIAEQLKVMAQIAIRINPEVSANSHPYISTGLKENKFGIAISSAASLAVETKQLSHLSLQGLAFHIGSQITSLTPFVEALEKVLALVDTLIKQGIPIKHLNIGGGLGVCYQDETPPSPLEYAQIILERLHNYPLPWPLELHLEPGRILVAAAGLLLTRIEYLKDQFAIVDASMNDLLRPALYGAVQEIVPVKPHNEGEYRAYDIVGPVCETADFLGKNRNLCLKAGDLLAVLTTGAYGFSMSSNYNSRPRVAEVMVDKDHHQVIRAREKVEDLFASERVLTS